MKDRQAATVRYVFGETDAKKILVRMAASLAAPLLLILLRPLGLTLRQSAVAASVLLAVIWWSTGWVRKIPASLFLMLAFTFVSGAPLKTVFAFPLGETFPLIAVTYLFSRAIENSGLAKRFIDPLLRRFVKTPFRCMIAIVLALYATMYVIPQPLARMIILLTIFGQFLGGTDAPEETRRVLLFAVVALYGVINMSAKDADLIMNHVAAGFGSMPISNGTWMRAMLVPTLATCAVEFALVWILFRKSLKGLRIEPASGEGSSGERAPMTGREKAALAIILATVALWMTSSLHGINNTIVTVVATAALFAAGVLKRPDWKAIDVTTLVFLTAAFSIGGVMKACGAADKVFGVLKGIFPSEYSVAYLLVIVLVGMVMHLILGSNTTTLSVVVPGMLLLCAGEVSEQIIAYAGILSVSFHAILPFHSVAVMIAVSGGYFPTKYVTKLGIPTTLVVYLATALFFFPWWRLIGLG